MSQGWGQVYFVGIIIIVINWGQVFVLDFVGGGDVLKLFKKPRKLTLYLVQRDSELSNRMTGQRVGGSREWCHQGIGKGEERDDTR